MTNMQDTSLQKVIRVAKKKSQGREHKPTMLKETTDPTQTLARTKKGKDKKAIDRLEKYIYQMKTFRG